MPYIFFTITGIAIVGFFPNGGSDVIACLVIAALGVAAIDQLFKADPEDSE